MSVSPIETGTGARTHRSRTQWAQPALLSLPCGRFDAVAPLAELAGALDVHGVWRFSEWAEAGLREVLALWPAGLRRPLGVRSAPSMMASAPRPTARSALPARRLLSAPTNEADQGEHAETCTGQHKRGREWAEGCRPPGLAGALSRASPPRSEPRRSEPARLGVGVGAGRGRRRASEPLGVLPLRSRGGGVRPQKTERRPRQNQCGLRRNGTGEGNSPQLAASS